MAADSGIVRQLDTLAKLQDRSRNDIVNEAIENFLELHAWREERIRVGIKAADQGRFAERAEVGYSGNLRIRDRTCPSRRTSQGPEKSGKKQGIESFWLKPH